MKNKKEKLVVILLVVGLIVMTGVISFAAFRFTQTGSVLNQITTGSITMSYTESSNVISMTGALPTTDATGKVRLNEGEYFDFTVGSSITGTANINFEIAAQELDGNTIDGSYIKYYLTSVDSVGNETEVMSPKVYTEETSANEYTGRPSNMMSLYEGSMNASTTTKYRLRLYVDESYNPQGDGGNLIYKVRVNVYGLAGDEVEETLAPGVYYSDGTFASFYDLDAHPDGPTEVYTNTNREIWFIPSNPSDFGGAEDAVLVALVTPDDIGVNFNGDSLSNYENIIIIDNGGSNYGDECFTGSILTVYCDGEIDTSVTGGTITVKPLSEAPTSLIIGEEKEETLAPGLYAEDGTMTYSWQELIDAEYLIDSDGELSGNSSVEVLVGKLVINSSVVVISEYAFNSYVNLTSVTIPSGVSINDCAFFNCSNLTSINYLGTQAEWNALERTETWNMGCPEITVHCTDGDIVIPAA